MHMPMATCSVPNGILIHSRQSHSSAAGVCSKCVPSVLPAFARSNLKRCYSWHSRVRLCQTAQRSFGSTTTGARSDIADVGNPDPSIAVHAHGANSADHRIFIFGLGYCGVALAAELHRRHWHVSGTCRSEDAVASFRREQIDAYVLDPDNDVRLSVDAQRALASASYVVTTVPPVGDFDADPVLAAATDQLEKRARGYRWVGYISSTGVYGDHGGAWVDESSTTQPTDIKAVARLKAEQDWLELHQKHGLPLHIFRLGGIYGPGRSALDAASQQKPNAQQQRRGRQRFTARCHVHDICQVVLASMQQPSPGAIYNVVDNEPAPRSVVFNYARQLLFPDGQPSELAEAAPFEAAEGSVSGIPLAEKRVSNSKLNELGVKLKFPTFREGLSAIHERDLTPFK